MKNILLCCSNIMIQNEGKLAPCKEMRTLRIMKATNNIKFQAGSKTSCDAAYEEPKPQPLVCKCQNGGFCIETESGETECRCEENFTGEYCDIGKDAIIGSKAGSKAAIAAPVILIIMVIICAISLYVYYQRKRGE
mgnify:CR=1 FL=1